MTYLSPKENSNYFATVKLTAGVFKKLGLPGFSSVGFNLLTQ